jgi:hypothetical protein
MAAVAGFSIAFAGAGAVRAQEGDPEEEQPKPEESKPTKAGRGIEQGDFDNYSKAEQKRKKKVVPEYGVGLRLRGVFEPAFMMNLFVEEQTSGGMPCTPASVSSSTRRKGEFELVLGFEYENISPSDGYWLRRGRRTSPGLYLTSSTSTLSWFTRPTSRSCSTRRSTEKVAFRHGAGFGLGIVFGDALQTDQVCSAPTSRPSA